MSIKLKEEDFIFYIKFTQLLPVALWPQFEALAGLTPT